MASVFLAEDTELDRRVAIKRLHPDSGPESAPRFRREMRVAAGLSHPNIVTLFDAIEDDGAVLLVMEYVDGPSLAERLRDGPLAPATAMAILRPLAAAVDHLHEQGVIHRDVKPANVLLDRADRVKLADLGIASAGQATGITRTGSMLGTPAYMAPELFDGDPATAAADVFSVAAIAFEMFSGRRARESGTPAAIAVRAATAPPPDLRDDRPDEPALAAVLARGMARDPAGRPATATALVDAIAAALREDERPARRRGRARPRTAPGRTARRRARAPPCAAGGRAVRRRGAGAPPCAARGRAVRRRGAGARRAPREDERAAAAAPVPARAPRDERPAAAPAPDRARRSPALLLAAVGVLAAAVLAVLLLTGGGDPNSGDRAGSGTSATTTGGTSSTGERTTSTGATAATAGPSTPAGAVRAFYTRAAAHRYADAWALAAPDLRAQLGGYEAFRRQFSTVRSIVFSRAAEVRRTDGAATVAIATTATHTDRVDRCTGTADTAPGTGGGWLVTHVNVSC